MILNWLSTDGIPGFEIKEKRETEVNLHGWRGNSIMGEVSALGPGSFAAAELESELEW